MSYLVLARKWRPQVFEEVIGQRAITQTLQNAIAQNRVAHAFLFTGARGVGKTSTARILAKALNCESGPRINPCNQCTHCHEIASGTSMDVIEIDGASNRGIDEIRELRESVRYTPAKSRYKIFIIDEVHMLTREAFNALLKTLEEPPPHILFVFATTEPHKIPTTILSRCQQYDFKRIPLKEIAESLRRIVDEEKVKISQRSLLVLARESEGSMRDAQSLLDQVISYAGKEITDEDVTSVLGLVDRKILHDTLVAITEQQGGRCMDIVEQVYQYGYDVQHFCRELLQCLRHVILLKVTSHPETLIDLTPEELGAFRTLSEKFSFDHWNHLFNLLVKGEEEISQSTFPRTMLEVTLLRMATLRPVLPIDEILKKLEGLGRGGEGDPGAGRERKEVQPVPRGVPREFPKESKRTGEETMPSAHHGRSLSTQTPEDKPGGSEREPLEQGEEESAQGVSAALWQDLVDFSRARSPVVGSFLALGELVRMSEGQIDIGFEKDSFHYDRMLEVENRKQLEQICRDYFKKEMKLVITTLNEGARPRGRAAVGNGGFPPRGREKRDDPHPLIQEAVRLFDGKIIEG